MNRNKVIESIDQIIANLTVIRNELSDTSHGTPSKPPQKIKIDDLSLNPKIKQILTDDGLVWVSDLQKKGVGQFRKLRGIGPDKVAKIIIACFKIGIRMDSWGDLSPNELNSLKWLMPRDFDFTSQGIYSH